MPFAPVDPETKQKVISAYLASRGTKSQNQIRRELQEQGVKVSRSSMNNFVNAYKKSLQKKEPTILVPINPSFQDNTGEELNQDVDFSDQPFDEAIVESLLSQDYNPALDGVEGERLLGINSEQIEEQTPSHGYLPLKEQINTLGAQYNSHEKVTQIQEIPEKTDRYQLRTTATTNPTRPEVEDTLDLDLGIDYDEESSHQARLVKWVMYQKKIQANERHRLSIHWKNLERKKILLEREKQKLSVEKQEFYEAENSLSQRIYQVQHLLPIADEMKRLGLDFTIANAFLICVKGIAERRGLSEKQAVWKLADDLKNFEFLGGFETSIQNAKHQLELLEYAIEEKKQAIATLVDLRKMGIYDREIIQVMETIKPKNNGHSRDFQFDPETNLSQSRNNNPFGDN
jgi:hypothetical protein